MLTSEQKKQYQNQGYVIFPDFFGETEIGRLTRKIDAFDEESERELQKLGQRFLNIPGQINFNTLLNKKDAEIRDFYSQPKLAELAMDILGPDVQLYFDQSVYKRPEADRDFPWHQDNGYIPIEPTHYLTCWIALEDATIENGCIWVMPASHRQGFVEHVKTEIGWQCYFGEDPGTAVPLKRGSMVAFHSLLFHRSTPNRSQSTRKGLVLQYSAAGARHPETKVVFDNGPVLTRDWNYIYESQGGRAAQ